VKRAVIAVVVLLAGVAGVLGYHAAARDREYRRFIAEGEAAALRDQTFVAIEAFSGAIALRPDAMLGYLKRGETYQRRGDYESASRDLQRAAELDPAAPRPIEQMGDLEYALQRYSDAASHYSAYVQLDDRSPRVQYKLALALYRAGQAPAAVKPLREAVQLQDRFAEAYYLLGLALRDTDQVQDALDALRKAVDTSRAFPAPREELADLYRALGRTRDEIEELDALAALDPRPDRYVALGLAQARAGRREAAVLTLGKAVERFPEYRYTYVALGRVWLESAQRRQDRVDLSKAIEALEQALAGTERNHEALTLLGQALLMAGDAELAERWLGQAVETSPVEPRAYELLAEAGERLGHFGDARDAMLRYHALAGEPSSSDARAARARRLGDLAMRAGDAGAAETWLLRAAELTTPDSRLLESLADAQWRAGHQDAARATLQRGLEQDPTHRGLLALQRRFR
jgi:tetratricopeptide (TPR) repeat protein